MSSRPALATKQDPISKKKKISLTKDKQNFTRKLQNFIDKGNV
jgi:hypothetical protein